MATQIDYDSFDERHYRAFSERLEGNLRAMARVLERPGFGIGEPTLGAELELCLIDRQARACPVNREVLARSVDPHLTLEIDRFNLEYNLTPVPARGRPFEALQRQLSHALTTVDREAAAFGASVIPIGILPTLREEDLESSALTDLARYRALSCGLRRSRPRPFEVHIDGPDPLSIACPDITLEGANTSFQVHLRVNPGEFAACYNACQLATPLAIALGANSPIFLGHRLWDETRIALFKQSLDVRRTDAHRWRAPARVGFGHGWLRQGPWELFAEAVALFPPILPIIGDEDAEAVVASGGLPQLAELRLHQGTVWRWNRAIFDPGPPGHVRIEMRALPAGPTPVDMAANAAFLVGLTMAWRDRVDELLPRLPFIYAEWNFYRAAQRGLDARMLWPAAEGTSPVERPLREVAELAIPESARGLRALGVDDEEIERTMGVIRTRLTTGQTAARWQRRTYEAHARHAPRAEALARLVETYVANSRSERPVHEWE